MRVVTGTSGFSYKSWKGAFYPAELAEGNMLEYYAERLPGVEINNTFYRMPRGSVLAGWSERVPERFLFALKASQRITHKARLKDCDELLGYLWSSATKLGSHLGPLLFQLPPYLRADVPRLQDFLQSLPPGCRPVLEFRHDSWACEPVYQALADAGSAFCIAETDDAVAPEVVATASWGYLRLRRAGYEDDELGQWAARIREQSWSEVYVFFKHEDTGPALAQRLNALLAG